MKWQTVTGTFDILPEQQARWQFVYQQAAQVLGRAGVREITPPIFEYSEVFTKSAGESSDLVVQKEMYTFSDAGERSLTLRPEFTPGVLRAYIEHLQMRPNPIKLWSKGPAFRAEKPQRGRFRQFHQIDCELLGLDSPLLDAEAIALMYGVLSSCGLPALVVKLGSVGDPQDRRDYNAYLRDALAPQRHKLSEASQRRLELNPMRLFDSKDEGDQALLASLKKPLEMLNPEAQSHFDAVRGYLEAWNIPYELEPSLVRGLDYYRRTAFEVHYQGIGSQSALGGGGRYDGLVENLGGPATPGVGWALGVERVLDALETHLPELHEPKPLLFLVAMDDQAVDEVAALAFRLRQHCHVEHSYSKRNPGKGLKEADRSGARFAALRGSREREAGGYQLKELASGEQRQVSETELEQFVASYQPQASQKEGIA